MQLKYYIQGKKQGKEANRMEREALNDPFLHEALEGFDEVPGDHAEIIDRLEKRFALPNATQQPSRRRFLYWSIAASILLLIGFGSYFLLERNRNPVQPIAMVQPHAHEEKNKISVDSPVLQPLQAEKLQQESLMAEKVTKKAIPAPAVSTTIPVQVESLSQSEIILTDTNQTTLSDFAEARETAEISAKQTANEQEKHTIHGKVVDEAGEPLVGVSIVKKGTNNGTTTDINGAFMLQLPIDDSSKLLASYLGFKSQEINLSDNYQTVILKPDNQTLSEVVVVAFGTQKKSSVVGSVAKINEAGFNRPFGEEEFQTWCQQKADKNVCGEQGATVKVSFFIDETGKPVEIEFKKYSCEEAKKEIEKLLTSSPVWTTKNRKVTMTIKW